ncbi:MAG: class I SAM-dependent methyltransferase [Anaerolineales bacterium]
MDHFKHIYRYQAHAYHRMISSEDVDSNLAPAIERIAELDGKRVLDLGTGTGRIPLLLHERVAQLVGLDLYRGMLQENMAQRRKVGGDWALVRGDMRALPFPGQWADVIVAGWAIGHLRSWFEEEWQARTGAVLKEMHRVVQAGGALIILETLTTGSLTPAPPTKALAEYYAWLEENWGFERQEIQTDYGFPSVAAAAEHTEFFFGAELARSIRENGWARLPEWTGVWGKTVRGES